MAFETFDDRMIDGQMKFHEALKLSSPKMVQGFEHSAVPPADCLWDLRNGIMYLFKL